MSAVREVCQFVVTTSRWLAGRLLLSCVTAGCAAPVPSYDAYRQAALSTATSMAGDLASGRLAASIGLRSRAWSAFTDDSVTEAENDADSVSSVFTSRQPPDGSSRQLSGRVSAALSAATSALTSLRIAVRSENHDQVRRALAAVNRALRKFEHLMTALR
jgi:hypothetical protein